jgi:phosphate:Na+ symporter
MVIIEFALKIFAAALLLLFAVGLVRSGVERNFGHHFSSFLGNNRSPAGSGIAGAGLAVALQSSAAVALLICGFATTGMMSFSTGFAALLGADLGSALVVQILSFNLSWLEPLLLVVGGWLYLKSDRPEVKTIGQIILGLALILVALHLLREAVGPLRDSTILPAAATYIEADHLTGFIAGAVLAFLLHSSVAAILMCVALIAAGGMSFIAGLTIVLGANLGSALIAVWLTRDLPPVPRRIPLANALVRGSMAFLVMLVLGYGGFAADLQIAGAAASLIFVHMGFNLGLAILFIPLARALEKPMAIILPAPADDPDMADVLETSISAVGQSGLAENGHMAVALTAVRQDILKMLEEVERMYRPIMSLFDTYSEDSASAIKARDERVNALFTDLRHYMAENARSQMKKRQRKETRTLLEYAIRVEAAGDLVAKRLTTLAAEKDQRKASFSETGATELIELHALVQTGFGLARHVLLVDDIEAARRLVLDKAEVKRREQTSRKAHLKRLESGQTESLVSSDVHLEVLRTLAMVRFWIRG